MTGRSSTTRRSRLDPPGAISNCTSTRTGTSRASRSVARRSSPVQGDGSQPAVQPDGTVVSHNWTIGAGGVLYGFDPTSGQPKWSFSVSPNNVTTAPDCGH